MAPLLQTMIDALGWQTTYRIMAGVVPVFCLSGLTYSPNVQSEDAENYVLEDDAQTSLAQNIQNEQGEDKGASVTQTLVEEETKGFHVYITVWKEPKFVATVISAAVIAFGHFVPLIHLVNIYLRV